MHAKYICVCMYVEIVYLCTHSYIKGKIHYSLYIQGLYFYPWLTEEKLSLK